MFIHHSESDRSVSDEAYTATKLSNNNNNTDITNSLHGFNAMYSEWMQSDSLKRCYENCI